MSYDVVVVGGGIGGLTVAALLSTRGLSTCLLERQSEPGGCVSRVEFANHEFDPGMGLYSEWGPGEIHQQIFSELKVSAPAASILNTEYVVRLPDQTDVRLARDEQSFFSELRKAFPECGDRAVQIYETIHRTAAKWKRTQSFPADTRKGSTIEIMRRFWSETGQSKGTTLLSLLTDTSDRFKTFLDAQLRAFGRPPLERCGLVPASLSLTAFRRNLYSIAGGPGKLAEVLGDTLKAQGGSLRLNSPVLRLAYNENGEAVGVDLLSGERVFARRAIISNMTLWDTYGKLIGLNRTSAETKKRLNGLQAEGAYLIYASMDQAALKHLPSDRLLVVPTLPHGEFESDVSEFTVNTIGVSAPQGKCAVTIKSRTRVEGWFTFQSSTEDYDEWDQAALESLWAQLHRMVPELGGDIEVIETANPRTFYEQTRRKLGMVLGVEESLEVPGENPYGTSLPNVFIVGDTVSSAATLASVSRTALNLANELTR